MMQGFLEVCYQDNSEKMKKSEIWAILAKLSQITKIGNFQPKSSLRAQTQKGMPQETKIPYVSMK